MRHGNDENLFGVNQRLTCLEIDGGLCIFLFGAAVVLFSFSLLTHARCQFWKLSY